MKTIPIVTPLSGPADKPKVVKPVTAFLDVPVFYATERGPIPSSNGIVCSEPFADTVLKTLNDIALKYGWALVHVGVYNPRLARDKRGRNFYPPRWSNHAYAQSIDFKGIITEHGSGQYLNIHDMAVGCPMKLNELIRECQNSILHIKKRPEMVDEGGWYHIGFWH